MACVRAVREANVRAAASSAFAGRRAVVVGATSGIGRAIALRLAEAGFTVTAVGRSRTAGEAVLQEMNALGGTGHEFTELDASLLRNAYQFGQSFRASHDTLDLLVMTPGIATTQGRTETSEGIDVKLAVHYFSRMALTDALLPALRNGRSPRVLSVLSGGVHSVYEGYKTDFELKTSYSLKNAADAAGFYNDLCLDAFSKQPDNAKVTFIHAAPGFIKTNWGTEMPFVIRMAVRAVQVFGRSPADCAEYMCTPLLQPQDTDGGFKPVDQYGQPARVTRLHDEARDSVWESTRGLLARFRGEF